MLEIGCGNGLFWQENLHAIPDQLDLTLTDLSAGMLDAATQGLAQSLSYRSLVVDAQSLPFDDDAFDIVIANYMLYHVPDTHRAIHEIRRVLKPAGHLYAATNGIEHMRDLLQLSPEYRPDQSVARQFALESGADKLATAFVHIERRDFIDHLEITDVQPVLDYLESTSTETPLTSVDRRRISAFVEHAIANHGSFHVRKATGLFIASGSAIP